MHLRVGKRKKVCLLIRLLGKGSFGTLSMHALIPWLILIVKHFGLFALCQSPWLTSAWSALKNCVIIISWLISGVPFYWDLWHLFGTQQTFLAFTIQMIMFAFFKWYRRIYSVYMTWLEVACVHWQMICMCLKLSLHWAICLLLLFEPLKIGLFLGIEDYKIAVLNVP